MAQNQKSGCAGGNAGARRRPLPGDAVPIVCEKCKRSGQYRKQKLIERFGAETRLPDLRMKIAKCDREDLEVRRTYDREDLEALWSKLKLWSA